MSRLNLLLLGIFLIIVTGLMIWDSKALQRGFSSIFKPVAQTAALAHKSVFIGGAKDDVETLSLSELQAEYAALKRSRDALVVRVREFDSVLSENTRLREALSFEERTPYDLIVAQVISRKGSSWYETAILNRGSAHGILPDSPVVVAQGSEVALVGRVTQVVGENSATMLLLSDEMCQVAAVVEETQEQGILSGTPDIYDEGLLQLGFLPRETTIQPQQQIFTSGDGGLFPAGLVLGSVLRIKNGILDSQALVQPAVSLNKLKEVFILRPQVNTALNSKQKRSPDGKAEKTPDEDRNEEARDL